MSSNNESMNDDGRGAFYRRAIALTRVMEGLIIIKGGRKIIPHSREAIAKMAENACGARVPVSSVTGVARELGVRVVNPNSGMVGRRRVRLDSRIRAIEDYLQGLDESFKPARMEDDEDV